MINFNHAHILPVSQMRKLAEEYHNMKIDKLAEQDAERWLLAEMFYGEGADIRRRHLNAEFDSKFQMPGYTEAFYKAYDLLDKNKFAQLAIKERKKIDRTAKAGKNFRALKSGNLAGLSTGVYIIVGGVIVARATGYDKVIEAEVKKGWTRAKEAVDQVKQSRKIRKAKAAVYNVTNIHEDPKPDEGRA
jgi:hypothetical protein